MSSLVLQLSAQETRQQAARELVKNRDVVALSQGLRHSDPSIRHACLWALDRCAGGGVFGIIPALIKSLEDRDPKVRALATQLLRRRIQRMDRKSLLNLRHVCHRGLAMLIEECLEPSTEPPSTNGGQP